MCPDKRQAKQASDRADTYRLMQTRLKKMEDASNNASYPNQLPGLSSIRAVNREFAAHDRDSLLDNKEHYRVVAGRLMTRRGNFMLIQVCPAKEDQIQLYLNPKSPCFASKPTLVKRIELWDLGDIVAAAGYVRRSGKGDLYIDIDCGDFEPCLLAKSIQPPPEKYHGLKDTEARLRQRYLDLSYNAESWRLFSKRSEIITAVRRFFAERDYTEVETPVLHAVPGGATAKPFTTHHDSLSQDMYLRISPELYLKRLIVGGMSRIYEIGNSFRNEGLSPRHNPEFTMLEFYCAYATWRDMIETLREMWQALIPAPHVIRYDGCDYSFASDRVAEKDFLQLLADRNTDLGMEAADAEKLLLEQKPSKKVVRYMQACEIDTHPKWTNAKLLLELFEKTVEPTLKEPTFVVNYPALTSPLARPHDDRPWLAQRFEFFVHGIEVANGCSELNDPVLQYRRFAQQELSRKDGDEEAMLQDRDYLDALSYGMPPAAGAGVGVDRLVMLLCDARSVRDARLFPNLRSGTPTDRLRNLMTMLSGSSPGTDDAP